MVDVGMGEKDEIDRLGIETEGMVVFRARLAPALKHAAIHQKACAAGLHQTTGTGDFARGAKEGEFHVIKGIPPE